MRGAVLEFYGYRNLNWIRQRRQRWCITGPGPGLGPTGFPPVCHGVLSDSPLCRASRGTSECRASGVGPTVTRDTQGESCRTQPWPWPRNLCHILQNCAALRAALILPCCAALRAALRLRNFAVLRTAGPVIYHFSTFRLAVSPT